MPNPSLHAFTLLLILVPEAAAADAGPHGRYCGQLVAGRGLVDVVTEFTSEPGGGLTGRYEFDDGGSITAGTLTERSQETGFTRTLVWRDEYGAGTLTVTFDATFESFAGSWIMGSGPGAPLTGHSWNGQRCRGAVDAPSSSAALINEPRSSETLHRSRLDRYSRQIGVRESTGRCRI